MNNLYCIKELAEVSIESGLDNALIDYHAAQFDINKKQEIDHKLEYLVNQSGDLILDISMKLHHEDVPYSFNCQLVSNESNSEYQIIHSSPIFPHQEDVYSSPSDALNNFYSLMKNQSIDDDLVRFVCVDNTINIMVLFIDHDIKLIANSTLDFETVDEALEFCENNDLFVYGEVDEKLFDEDGVLIDNCFI